MMQNLFGDQSEDEEEADDDDVVEVVDDDDDQRQESPPQQQRHQELDDDEEGDARSHAHARSDEYHSDLRSQLQELIPEQQCDNKDYFPSDPTEMQGWRS